MLTFLNEEIAEGLRTAKTRTGGTDVLEMLQGFQHSRAGSLPLEESNDQKKEGRMGSEQADRLENKEN